MKVAPTGYQPDIAIAPGATIREMLESLCMSQVTLAERLGRPASAINEIIQGKKAITAETAIGLARVLPYPAEFWMQLERNYQLTQARIQEAEQRDSSIAWMLETFPLSELHNRGFISGGRGVDRAKQLEDLLRFFAVGSVPAWKDYWGECVSGAIVAFRRSEAQSHIGRIASWLRIGEIEAQKRPCRPFNHQAFLVKLRELRGLTSVPPDAFIPGLYALSECGVIVTVVKEIQGAGVSGATRWMSKSRAHIQLSLRHKTDDQFWFSFFHEAGHVVNPRKDTVFIEGDDATASDLEAQANEFARDILIPQKHLDELKRLRNRAEISRFAEKLGIAPGIVVGRLQFEELLSYPAGNAMHLKRKYQWVEK
jgi:addiction module HigA family antidote